MLVGVLTFVSLIALLPSVIGQATEYGQCGGIGWTGATTCVTGYACTFLNAWFSQCLLAPKPTSSSSSVSSTPSERVNYWFSFGDDWTSTGFQATGTPPKVGNPLGNPPYPGNTPDGGPNWIDAITTVYNPTTFFTYNFASPGATTIPAGSTALNLEQQVIEFVNWDQGVSPPPVPWYGFDTLFSFWIGNNDIPYALSWTGNRTAYIQNILEIEFELVQELYSLGGRKFLWINVAPLNRSPQALASSTTSAAAEVALIATYNELLAEAISGFKANHTDVTTYLYDINTAINTFLDSPGTYGFTSATAYGHPGDFWQTPTLPTSAAQLLFAKDISTTVLNETIF